MKGEEDGYERQSDMGRKSSGKGQSQNGVVKREESK